MEIAETPTTIGKPPTSCGAAPIGVLDLGTAPDRGGVT
jgi:hypothetical protein